MSVELACPRPPHVANRTPRRTIAERLRAALLALAQGQGEVCAHSEKAWASVTFAGARHRIELRFTGAAAVAPGEGLIANLPDHEFTIPGHLVADAGVVAADHRLLPEPELRVVCELLLLEES